MDFLIQRAPPKETATDEKDAQAAKKTGKKDTETNQTTHVFTSRMHHKIKCEMYDVRNCSQRVVNRNVS